MLKIFFKSKRLDMYVVFFINFSYFRINFIMFFIFNKFFHSFHFDSYFFQRIKYFESRLKILYRIIFFNLNNLTLTMFFWINIDFK